MKKISLLSLSFLVISVMLSGCQVSVDYVKQSQKYPWILANASSSDTITSIFSYAFKDEVEKLSNGRMQIEVYENSTLGGDRELIESCLSKDVKFIVQNTAPQVSFMPDLAVFDLPMAYDDIEEVRKVLDDETFKNAINEVYNEAGFRLLSMADQDFRVMTTNKKIESLADFSGQKIRTMENNYHLRFWQSIGANPTPMSFSEVYIGLQQKTIDAQENPIEVIVSSRLYEQQDYIVMTNHLPHLLSLITNDDFMNDLSVEDQEIIEQAAINAQNIARKSSDARIAEKMQVCVDSGTKIVELDETTKQAMREKNAQLYDDIRAQVDPALYDAYLKYADWR